MKNYSSWKESIYIRHFKNSLHFNSNTYIKAKYYFILLSCEILSSTYFHNIYNIYFIYDIYLTSVYESSLKKATNGTRGTCKIATDNARCARVNFRIELSFLWNSLIPLTGAKVKPAYRAMIHRRWGLSDARVQSRTFLKRTRDKWNKFLWGLQRLRYFSYYLEERDSLLLR